jgi:ABC-type antimicrobial peptide transport system permease subunit
MEETFAVLFMAVTLGYPISCLQTLTSFLLMSPVYKIEGFSLCVDYRQYYLLVLHQRFGGNYCHGNLLVEMSVSVIPSAHLYEENVLLLFHAW